MFLADAAPTGTGLAIIGVILLVMLAVGLLVTVIVIRALFRRFRGTPPAPPPPATLT